MTRNATECYHSTIHQRQEVIEEGLQQKYLIWTVNSEVIGSEEELKPAFYERPALILSPEAAAKISTK